MAIKIKLIKAYASSPESHIRTLEGLPDRTYDAPTDVSSEITRG